MIILDVSALSALVGGHPRLHRLVDDALHSPFRHLIVPALCLVEAQVADEGAASRILALPTIEVEPLDAAGAVTVGTMVRDGYGSPGLCHAIATCLPTPLRPTQHLILTGRQQDYPPGVITVDIDDPRLEG